MVKKIHIEIYSTQNEGQSVGSERFIGTLKNKIYRYMTGISKNVYIDKLDDIVNKCNNTYYRTIRMKPINVKSSTYIDSDVENDPKDLKIKVGDHVEIPKYKNIFPKGYSLNCSPEVFVIKKSQKYYMVDICNKRR